MRLPEEPDLPPSINILPMIDVIFAILVFFIVSSLYLTRSEGLSVNLPRAATTEVQKTKQITVSIDQAGDLTVNSKATSLTDLKTTLEKLMKTEKATMIVINADTKVEHGVVVDAMDQIRQIPNAQLAIAAKKKE